MNILYISNVLPEKYQKEVLRRDKNAYTVAQHKFHRNILKGLMSNSQNVMVLTLMPPCLGGMPNTFVEDGISYEFLGSGNNRIGKYFSIVINVLKSIKRYKREGFKPDAIMCDSLNISLCLGALIARCVFGIKATTIVTDLPDSISSFEKSFFERAASYISSKYISMFDRYVILTEQMNKIVNPHNKPFIVMEGVCDTLEHHPQNTQGIRKLFYAGGRPAKDGIDILIPAFKKIKSDNIQLNIYGKVPDVAVGPDPDDPRIVYHGVVPNDEIVREECNSYLLINPRPTNEEYTKYSFPSKVMEYMATGVPIVTTKLAGIPGEYFSYVFTFDKCEIDSYYKTLLNILSLDPDELKNKGKEAQDFVLKQKNNIVQTSRIVELLKIKNNG